MTYIPQSANPIVLMSSAFTLLYATIISCLDDGGFIHSSHWFSRSQEVYFFPPNLIICVLFFAIVVVQLLSYLTLCNPMNYRTTRFSVLHHLPELSQTHVHRVSEASNHLNLCHPLLLLPSNFPSIRVFSNDLSLCISWPKYWSFSFKISK